MNKDERSRFFYAPPGDLRAERFFFSGDEARHVTRSLRLGEGARVTVVDGEGNGALVALFREGERTGGEVIERFRSASEPPVLITLAVGLPKRNGMDEIVERGAEIGVARFLPFEAERTVIRSGRPREGTREERWRRIALASMKVARGARLSRIDPTGRLEEVIAAATDHDRVFLLDREGSPFPVPRVGERVLLVVGPEGGFTPEEEERLRSAGARTLSLGPRNLRTATAALVAAARFVPSPSDAGSG
ncbi:MAG: RsmE family RNA methyltransferase [Candidatus Eisenbacteria bacterium]